MANARILLACDAAVETIDAAWTDKGKCDGVQRVYAPPINLTEDAEPVHTGRQVYVFPGPYTTTLYTRGDQWRGYTLRALMVERYVDAGDVPDEWIDERVSFFEQGVFNLLANQGLTLIDEMAPALDETATIDLLYDVDMLLKLKTFWCLATFPYAEDTDLTGGVEP